MPAAKPLTGSPLSAGLSSLAVEVDNLVISRRAADVLRSNDPRVWQAFYPEARADADTLAVVLDVFRRAGPLPNAARLFAASFCLLATVFERRYLGEMRAAIDPFAPHGDAQCALLQMLLQIALNNFCSSHRQAVDWRREADIDSLYYAQAAAILQRMPGWQTLAPPDSAAPKRVLIVAANLSVLEHPPTRLVLEHAKALRAEGHAVRIIGINDELSTEIAQHSGVMLPLARSPHVRAQWQRALGHDIKVWAARPQDTFDARWGMLLEVLQLHRPNAVLYIGIGSAVTHLLYGRVPLITLATSGYPLESPADVELLSSPQLWPDRGRSIRYAFRASVKPSLLLAPVRDLPGVRGGIKLISIGNRLGVEIAGPWAECMAQLLRARPDVHWLLIGDTRLPPALQAVRRQVTTLPHQKELGSFYQSASVYVNPPRLGGGLSVLEAMACGLPVVALEGGDGGDKVGPDAATSEDDYFARLQTVLDSPSARAALAARQQARFRDALDMGAAGPALTQAIELAVGNFSERLAVAAA